MYSVGFFFLNNSDQYSSEVGDRLGYNHLVGSGLSFPVRQASFSAERVEAFLYLSCFRDRTEVLQMERVCPMGRLDYGSFPPLTSHPINCYAH